MNKLNRNQFIKLSSFCSLSAFLNYNLYGLDKKESNIELDKYGGWKAKKFQRSGFFRTEFDGNKWWFVTPEGNGFISLGINHYHQDWWAQQYNKDFWLRKFNSKEYLDDNWNIGYRERALSDMKLLGINTIGMHTNASSLIDLPFNSKVPYLREYKPIVLDHYRNPKPEIYIDIFSKNFEKYCYEYAREIALPYKDDSMLLGYCMADCPIFTEGDIELYGGISWARKLRNLGPMDPGKREFVSIVKKKYKIIENFNGVYLTSFKTWEELLNKKRWRENIPALNKNEQDDIESFMLSCVKRYYSVSKKALFTFDSNHLFLGDKINGNTDSLDKTIPVISKYVDVIYYQYFASCGDQSDLLDRVSDKVDLPFLNGDAGFGVSYEMMPNPYGPRAKTQSERANWLLKCCENAFSRNNFIGWHICGIIDTWKTMPTKEKFQHQGLMSVIGEFYPEMKSAVQKISSNLYKYKT